MLKKTFLPAFTLMELLVVISIIGVLALGFSNINFSRLSQVQRVGIESAKIVNLIEETRNNALIGKGIGASLTTPESWSVTLENTSSSGSLISKYLSGSTSHTGSTWDSPIPFSINNLECRRLNDSADISTGPFTLIFTGSVGGISGCSDSSYKKINFDYGVGNLTQNITINTLSGVIEID